MNYCMSNPHEMSKVAGLKRQVDDVKNIMVDNIEKVLQRGEKIELLVDKTDNLRSQADKFHRQGKQLRHRMWMQNMKLKIGIAVIVLVVLLILILIICGAAGCFK